MVSLLHSFSYFKKIFKTFVKARFILKFYNSSLPFSFLRSNFARFLDQSRKDSLQSNVTIPENKLPLPGRVLIIISIYKIYLKLLNSVKFIQVT